MTEKTRGLPRYRPSRGEVRFRLPSGQDVLVCADDEKVEAELKRRALWAVALENAALGQSFVMTHTTPAGIEAFLWFGNANDGGFIWYSMPGAREMPEEVAVSILEAFGQPTHPHRGGFRVGLS